MSKLRDSKRRESQASPTAQEQEQASPRRSSRKLQPEAMPVHLPTSLGTASENPSPPHERIAERAYQLWEANGRPAGTDRADWFEAERLLRTQA
jgi:Protein of unknown function (DUF2934)